MMVVLLNSANGSVLAPRYSSAKLCTLASALDDKVHIKLENGSRLLTANWGILASDDFPIASQERKWPYRYAMAAYSAIRSALRRR